MAPRSPAKTRKRVSRHESEPGARGERQQEERVKRAGGMRWVWRQLGRRAGELAASRGLGNGQHIGEWQQFLEDVLENTSVDAFFLAPTPEVDRIGRD